MTRRAPLALTLALALACTAPSAKVDPPATLPPATSTPVDTVDDAPANNPTTVNVTNTPGTPWFSNSAVLLALIALPGGLLGAVGAYRMGMKKTDSDVAASRDAADLAALQIRDKSFGEAMTLLTETLKNSTILAADAAAYKARLETVETRQAEREQRERDQIARLAVLEERTNTLNAHLSSCGGGQPCPLAHLRRSP